MKYTAVDNAGKSVESQFIQEKPFVWLNTMADITGAFGQESGGKPNKKGYFAGDRLYQSYDALFNSSEFKEAIDWAKEDCEATGYTPVSEREARQYAVNKKMGYRIVNGVPVLYKRFDTDTASAWATGLTVGVPISAGRNTDMVTCFLIARNPKGKEKKVLIAKRIEVKKSKTLDVTVTKNAQPKKK